MKRTTSILLILSAAFLCASLSACKNPAVQQQIEANAIKDLDAAALGYLGGGKAGALAGFTAQEIANIRARQKTAAKQPAASIKP